MYTTATECVQLYREKSMRGLDTADVDPKVRREVEDVFTMLHADAQRIDGLAREMQHVVPVAHAPCRPEPRAPLMLTRQHQLRQAEQTLQAARAGRAGSEIGMVLRAMLECATALDQLETAPVFAAVANGGAAPAPAGPSMLEPCEAMVHECGKGRRRQADA